MPAEAAHKKPSPLGQANLAANWQTWAFLGGMLVYLLTRFIKIDQFPIYFFCDEAIQTMSAFDLIRNGFKDPAGNFLPAYFQNGGQYNLGLSVYWQMIPALLQRSVAITPQLCGSGHPGFSGQSGLRTQGRFQVKTLVARPVGCLCHSSLVPAFAHGF